MQNLAQLRAHPPLRRLAASAVLAIGLAAAAQAQSHHVKFDHVSLDQGLSQASANVILQDRKGFIWIGTQDGLNRYDGYRVEVFKHDPADPESLSDNFIIGLQEDRDGMLWVLTAQRGVLNRFDPATERFHRLVHDPDDNASLADHNIQPRAYLQHDSGILWFGSFEGGINQLDPAGAVTRIVHDPEDEESLSDDRISTIYQAPSGTVWVGTWGGGLHRVLEMNGAASRFQRYRHDPEDPTSLSHHRVMAIFEAEDGTVWIGTEGGLNRLDGSGGFERFLATPKEDGGLAIAVPIFEQPIGKLWIGTNDGLVTFDSSTSAWKHYRPDPQAPGGLSSDNLTSAEKDSTGTLWFGTRGGGINRYLPERDAFAVYRNDPGDPKSLADDLVNNIYEDRSGILWIGTFSGGASRYSRQKHKFAHTRRKPADPESLADNVVFSIRKDRAGTLWVGTQSGGLHRFDEAREKVVERYSLDPGSRRNLGSDYAACIYEDRRGRFWVGTADGGLALLDRDRGEIVRRYTHDEDDETSLSHDNVRSIFEDRRGDFWIGTARGWNRFDRQGETFERFEHDDEDPTSLIQGNIRLTHEDREGRLWVVTSAGLSRFDRDRRSFTHYTHDLDDPDSLGHDSLMDLYEDPQGIFWLATYGGGINRFDPAREPAKFTRFTAQDGLPSDATYSVLPDADGFLWVATNQGLSKFDPRRLTVRNFGVEDGLQATEFNDRAFFKSPGGEMFFGGINGFNSFFPRDIVASDYRPPVVLTSFRKLDRVVELERAADEIEEIVLSYKDRLFSFEFAALDYANPARNRYAYKLEGFDDDWIESGSRRWASYTNLDGGSYTFRVRGSNGDGVWNEEGEGAAVRLIVIPPPWKTWWAYGGYLLALLGTVLGYVRWKTVAHEKQLALQREELERERAMAARLRQIDKMKDEFLANTSHELRTPLNGIIGIAESLIDGAAGELAERARSNLSMIASSGRRLSHLVDDVLDFSKLKSHQIELRKRAVALRELVDVVMTLSQPLVADKDVELCSDIGDDLPSVAGDENRLQQILHNLIGNAVKFTDSGSVRISAAQRNGTVEVRVADTGVGIPADQREKIFESFEQVDASTAREYGGTGLGLTITRQLVELHGGEICVESEPGRGSEFIFTVPLWTGGEEAADGGPSTLARIKERAAVTSEAWVVSSPTAAGEAAGPALATPVAARPVAALEGRVLAVDDEPINLQVLENILTLARFEMVQALDGLRCLELLQSGRLPDLILLDVMMPRMTGFEVARRIREKYSANELPIILVTAKNQVSDLEEGLASGANDYLTKPFSKNELLARMRTHLSLSRAHTVEAENRRKTEELEQARAIQLSLLPKAPPSIPYLDVATDMRTASEVGGDYYDFFPQEDGALYVVTGDATGHGISAGMMVSMTKSALKALDVQSPHVLLTQLNQVMRAVHLERMQMALNVAYVTDSEIALASAAMPPAFLYRAASGEVEEILISGLPLGGLEVPDYPLRVFAFGPGDVLVLISDGLPERTDDRGELLGYEAVMRCVGEHGDQPAPGIVQALVDLGEAWSGGQALEDDSTVVVLKRI